MTSTATPRRRPVVVTAAAALVGVEGVAGVVSGIAILVAALAGHPSDRAVAVTLAAVLFVVGLGLGVTALGVLRARPSAQTPAYLAQFFALVVAWYQRSTLPAVSVCLGIVAIAGIVALSAPASRAALRRR